MRDPENEVAATFSSEKVCYYLLGECFDVHVDINANMETLIQLIHLKRSQRCF